MIGDRMDTDIVGGLEAGMRTALVLSGVSNRDTVERFPYRPDFVFENVGAAVWGSALKSLVRGGRIVTCGATTGDQPGADLRRVFIRQLQIYGSTLGNLSELQELLAFCSQHGVRPLIDSRYPMAQAHAALDRLASGQQFGKVAVSLV